jgi:hypothetical protein
MTSPSPQPEHKPYTERHAEQDGTGDEGAGDEGIDEPADEED